MWDFMSVNGMWKGYECQGFEDPLLTESCGSSEERCRDTLQLSTRGVAERVIIVLERK